MDYWYVADGKQKRKAAIAAPRALLILFLIYLFFLSTFLLLFTPHLTSSRPSFFGLLPTPYD
jgi:hypothetical protein